jgi:hypothetical protein
MDVACDPVRPVRVAGCGAAAAHPKNGDDLCGSNGGNPAPTTGSARAATAGKIGMEKSSSLQLSPALA